MALNLNGFAVFGAIATDRHAFTDIAADVNKAARTLITKQLKSKATDVHKLRGVAHALGVDFDLILDGFGDREIKTLIRKFDKHHPEIKNADPRWCLSHLRDLARGSQEPLAKISIPQKPRLTKKRISTGEQERLSSRAMKAVRKRKQ